MATFATLSGARSRQLHGYYPLRHSRTAQERVLDVGQARGMACERSTLLLSTC